jgi:4-hydroxyproline epimerase
MPKSSSPARIDAKTAGRARSYHWRMKTIHIIDSHTGGEPTRLVVAGGPDLGRGPLSERRERLREHYDDWRAGVVTEPRGSDVIVGALLCEPHDSSCSAGVIFFNNVGYLGMCGHGTIGLVASLAYMGRIEPGRHRIETPVGIVEATLNEDGSVSVRNVAAYRYRRALTVDVPGYGAVTGDVAWGGNWFFLVSEHGRTLEPARIVELTTFTHAIREALEAQGVTGAGGALIDHIELFAQSPRAGIDSRNFVLCPGNAYDRSPCGTGTSAKLACLAADGKLAQGETWRQESIIGSVFEGRYVSLDDAGASETDDQSRAAPAIDAGPSDTRAIVPTITGRAHIMAEGKLCFEQDDPFASGIPVA